jgi:hypothetical protein
MLSFGNPPLQNRKHQTSKEKKKEKKKKFMSLFMQTHEKKTPKAIRYGGSSGQ